MGSGHHLGGITAEILHLALDCSQNAGAFPREIGAAGGNGKGRASSP